MKSLKYQKKLEKQNEMLQKMLRVITVPLNDDDMERFEIEVQTKSENLDDIAEICRKIIYEKMLLQI